MKIISVVGYKKTGKTTLVGHLVKALKRHGPVGTIKHLNEHNINTPDTDTWKHAEAGADVVVAVTPDELVKFSRNNNLTMHWMSLQMRGWILQLWRVSRIANC